MDFAEAANALYDEVTSIVAQAERRGLSRKEIADELRRIATELDQERKQ